METSTQQYANLLQVIGGLSVLLLLAGLTLLEAGISRRKNVTSALTKNLACLPISITAFWITGYAFAFGGEHPMIGYESHFALYGAHNSSLAHFFVHSLVAAVPSSIIGGAMAERSHITGHLVMSFFTAGLVYPVAAHWIFHQKGWLYARNVVDIGGILPLHVLSGSVSLVGCLLLGRRLEKFGHNYRTRIQGHSTPIGYTGGGLIIVGLFGKSIGLTADNDSLLVGQVVTNNLLSCVGAGAISVFLSKFSMSRDDRYDLTEMNRDQNVKVATRKWSLYGSLNGCLAGLIGVQGGVGLYQGWAAWVVGLVSGCLYFLSSRILVLCRIDDPTEAVSLNLVPGIWGTLAAALLANLDLVGLAVDRVDLVGWALAGVAAVFAWSSVCAVLIMLILLFLRKLRIDVAVETLGIDSYKTEEQAYSAHQCDGSDKYLPTKSTSARPLPLMLTSSKMNIPSAAVEPISGKPTGGKEVVRSFMSPGCPTILVEDGEAALKESRRSSNATLDPPAPPPPYLPSLHVTAKQYTDDHARQPGPGIQQPHTGALVPMNVTELRVALKEQKKRLNATTNLMKKPSATLLNRDASGDISLTSSTNMQVDENIIDRTCVTEERHRETSLCEAKDPKDDVFSPNKDGSGIDAESGFGGSQSIINATTNADQMFQNEPQKNLLDKPRVSHVSEECDLEDDLSNVNDNSQLI